LRQKSSYPRSCWPDALYHTLREIILRIHHTQLTPSSLQPFLITALKYKFKNRRNLVFQIIQFGTVERSRLKYWSELFLKNCFIWGRKGGGSKIQWKTMRCNWDLFYNDLISKCLKKRGRKDFFLFLLTKQISHTGIYRIIKYYKTKIYSLYVAFISKSLNLDYPTWIHL